MFQKTNQSSSYQSGSIQQKDNIKRKRISYTPQREDVERSIYQKLQVSKCLNIVTILSIYGTEFEIEDIPLTLFQLMKKRQEISLEFSIQEIKLIMAQIINGYQHLRSLGITHRNLNPQTILVQQIKGRSIIKISDFSVSHLLMNNQLIVSRAGTPAYWAPEIMLHPNNGYEDNCDIFSLGVILHQLCFQTKMPQECKDEKELQYFFLNLQTQNFKCQTGAYVDIEMADLIERMIVYDPKKRVSWDELARIPYFQQPYLLLNDQYLIDFTKQLGSGMQGVIYLTIDVIEQIELCAKVIETTSYEGDLELKIYSKLKKKKISENIITVFDCIDDKNQTYVILEKCDQNIQQYFQKQNSIGDAEILDFLRQIIFGYIELQKQKIIHRDLKPENLLIKYEGRKKIVKIIDFGVSKLNYTKGLASTVAGTPIYSAPEVLELTGKGYTNKCDIYSLGVMLYQFVHKQPYYIAGTLEELKRFQKNLQQCPFTCANPTIFNDLIQKMLEYDPAKRISWEDLQVQAMILPFQCFKERESILQENISASILKYLDCIQIFASKLEQELIQYIQAQPQNIMEQVFMLFYFLLLFSQAALMDCQQIFEKQHIYIGNLTLKQEVDHKKINNEKLQGFIDKLQISIELLYIKEDQYFQNQQRQMIFELECKKLTCYDIHQYFNAIYKNQKKIYSESPLRLRYYLEKMSNIFTDNQFQNINNISYPKLAEKIKDENAQKQYLESKKNW